MEKESRISDKSKLIKKLTAGTLAGLVFIGQDLAGNPIETASQNQKWSAHPEPQGIERQDITVTPRSPNEANLLRYIDSALQRETSNNNNPSVENPQESLMPGDIAPETWGGAGIFDVMSVFVKDPEFTGQAVFFHKHGLDGFTYTLLAGRTATGEIVKGSNFKSGLDSISSSEELNLSLGGNGGAQLRYDKERKDLTFWMQGFPVGSLEDPEGRRISFVSQVKAEGGETGKSRLLHQPFPSETLHYYMRSGNQSTTEGDGTRFLLVAHASLRQMPSDTQSLKEGLPLVPPLSIVSFPGKSLYVVQPDSQIPGAVTSFVWQSEEGTPDLRAETSQKIKFDKGHPSGKVFPVPKKFDVLVNDQKKIKIKTGTEPTDSFAFSTVVPNPITGKKEQILISLPELQARSRDRKGLLYTQTIGVPATTEQPDKDKEGEDKDKSDD